MLECETSRAEAVFEQGQKVLGMRSLDASAEAFAEARSQLNVLG